MTKTTNYPSILDRVIRFGRMRMKEETSGFPAIAIYGDGKYLEWELDSSEDGDLMGMMDEAGMGAALKTDRIEYVFLVSDVWIDEPSRGELAGDEQVKEFYYSPWPIPGRKHTFMISCLNVREHRSEALLFDLLPHKEGYSLAQKPFRVFENVSSVTGPLEMFNRGFHHGRDIYTPLDMA